MAIRTRKTFFFDALWIIAIAMMIMVVFGFDNRLSVPYAVPKEVGLLILLVVGAIAAVAGLFVERKKKFLHSTLSIPLALLAAVTLISSVVSTTPFLSFFGQAEIAANSFVVLLLGLAGYSFMLNILNTPKRLEQWRVVWYVLSSISALILVLAVWLHVGFLVKLLPNGTTSFDIINSLFGLWLVVVALMAAGDLMRGDRGSRLTLSAAIAAAMSLIGLWTVNFTILWWFLAGGCVLIAAAIALDRNNLRPKRFFTLLGVTALIILGIIFGVPRSTASRVPTEVTINAASSMRIAVNTLKEGPKTALFGSGPGTFGIDFSRFRPESFNRDQLASGIRFTQPFSTAIAVIAEGGALGILAWSFVIAIVLVLVGLTYRASRRSATAREGGTAVLIAAIPWIILTIGAFCFYYTIATWWLWWTSLSMLIMTMYHNGQKVAYVGTVALRDSADQMVPYAFAIVIGLVAATIAVAGSVRWYAASLHFSAANQASSVAQTEAELATAIAENKHNSFYYAALASAYLSDAEERASVSSTDPAVVQTLIQRAFQQSTEAINTNPASVMAWQNAATIYETVAPVAPSVLPLANNAYSKAITLEPTNPLFYQMLGANNATQHNTTTAEEYFQKAISLKADYVDPYQSLARLYVEENKFDQAIDLYRVILQINPKNTDLLYDYGVLVYTRNNKDDRTQAETAWKLILSQDANNVSALYSLGSLYAGEGKVSEGLDYLKKAAALQPTNQQIKNKISSLTVTGPKQGATTTP